MLKYAWAEFVEKEKAVTVEKLAEGSANLTFAKLMLFDLKYLLLLLFSFSLHQIIYGSLSLWNATVPISFHRKMKFILMKSSAKDLALFMSLGLLFR